MHQQISFSVRSKKLTFCAMSIALATILSEIKLFHLPAGGSVTFFSMLFICLPGYWFGLTTGLWAGFAYGILQLITDPYVLFPAQLIVDYLLAFGAFGLSGLFTHSKNGLIKGYLAGVCGRCFFAVLSGWLFFGEYAWEGWNTLLYSIVYNASYIFSEAAVTVFILFLPPVKTALENCKKLALS